MLSPTGELVEVNSGGQVFFGFFRPAPGKHHESLLVLKFHSSRLTTQSEQFANELTRHLGVCAPNCRILREMVITLILHLATNCLQCNLILLCQMTMLDSAPIALRQRWYNVGWMTQDPLCASYSCHAYISHDSLKKIQYHCYISLCP